MISLKSKTEIQKMRAAGQVVAQILDELEDQLQPGITTWDLDAFAEKRIKELGAVSAFKGYHGFPAVICLSVNSEVVHGIPSKKRILNSGDIIGLDFGVHIDGWYADSARTLPVGTVSREIELLLERTKISLFAGIDQCIAGKPIRNIGAAVEASVRSYRYGVVREYGGHGIGRKLHEDPYIPNYDVESLHQPLRAGMVIAIEPMVNLGTHEVRTLEDQWTVVTQDGKVSAHFEHTIAITDQGHEILTWSPKHTTNNYRDGLRVSGTESV